MVTEKTHSFMGAMIEKPPVERDMDITEAGEASGVAGEMSGKTTSMSVMAASEQWKSIENGKWLRNVNWEPVGAPGDRRSRMKRKVRQPACKVTLQNQTIEMIARMIEAHVARDEEVWLGMKELLVERETKWDEHHENNVLWGIGIVDINADVLGTARVRQTALAQEARK